jgi:hypothetical protein
MPRRYSHSALKTAQRCLKQWSYKYIERLEPAQRPKYLERGSDLHELLAELYDDKKSYLEIFDTAAPADLDLLARYVTKWDDEDQDWEILHVEEEMEMDIGPYRLVFICDLIVRINGEVWIVDHKTVANIPDEADPYNMSDFQHLLYLAGVRQKYPEVRGFIFNYVRTKAPTQPALIKDGSRIAALRQIDTDYDSLRSFAEKEGQLGDPDVQDKLAILKLTPDRFFQRHYILANEVAIQNAYDDTRDALDVLAHAEDMGEYPRHVLGGYAGSAACGKCSYQSLCFADMTGMNREQVLFDYVQREKR